MLKIRVLFKPTGKPRPTWNRQGAGNNFYPLNFAVFQTFPSEHTEAQCLQRYCCDPLFLAEFSAPSGNLFQKLGCKTDLEGSGEAKRWTGRGRSKTGCGAAQWLLPASGLIFFNCKEGERKESSARKKSLREPTICGWRTKKSRALRWGSLASPRPIRMSVTLQPLSWPGVSSSPSASHLPRSSTALGLWDPAGFDSTTDFLWEDLWPALTSLWPALTSFWPALTSHSAGIVLHLSPAPRGAQRELQPCAPFLFAKGAPRDSG